MKVKFKDEEYKIVETVRKGKDKYHILLKDKYFHAYELTGLDKKESILKTDGSVVKEYTNGFEVLNIIDNRTGIGVGFYGVLDSDVSSS